MFGINFPKISLPKLDLGKIGQTVLKQGVEILKGVAKDLFTPAKDGKSIFKTDINAKVGPFDIKLKNPIEALAEKLLGKAGDGLKKLGLDPSVIGKFLGGQKQTTTDVPDVGPVDLPRLPERAAAEAAALDGAGGIGGATEVAAPTGTGAANVDAIAGGSDFGEKAISKFGGSITGLDSQIDAMMNKGGDLSATDQIKLQQAMQKRNEMFQLMTQIMQMEHETKKGIIGNIR